jgi:hypothetical protein
LSAKIKSSEAKSAYKSRVKRMTKDGDWIAHFESDSTVHDERLPSSSSPPTHPRPNPSSGTVSPLMACSSPRTGSRGDPSMVRQVTAQDTRIGIFSGDFIMHNFFWLHKIYECLSQMARGDRRLVHRSARLRAAIVLAQTDAILITNVLTDFYRAFPELKGHLIKPHIQRNACNSYIARTGRARHASGCWTRRGRTSFAQAIGCGTRIRPSFWSAPV